MLFVWSKSSSAGHPVCVRYGPVHEQGALQMRLIVQQYLVLGTVNPQPKAPFEFFKA